MLKWFKSHAQGEFAQSDETKVIATSHEEILSMKTLKTQVVEMVIFS